MFFFKRNKKKKADEQQAAASEQIQDTAEVQVDDTAGALLPEHTEVAAEIAELVMPDSAALLSTTAATSARQDSEDSGLIERDGAQAEQVQVESVQAVNVEPEQAAEPQEDEKKLGFFARIKRGLSRTSTQFAEGLGNLLLGKKVIDDELLEEIETQLLVADVGIEATTDIIDSLTAKVARKQLADSGALYTSLQDELRAMLIPVEQPMCIDGRHKPFVILVVGVNGVGKTTTIGKLAKRLQGEGKSVMLAAGDTFRAAAVEQLQIWGERNNVPVVAQHTGADSASVIFDAIASAQARNIDVVIADTAGRLHNKSHLMDELAKVRRVMAKLDTTAPHEVLLVLDAGTGQNAVNQADIFREAAGVTGLALTKLDGTAKGGVIFALTKKHQLPIRFIGVGETIDDLQPFAAKPFVDALFGQRES